MTLTVARSKVGHSLQLSRLETTLLLALLLPRPSKRIHPAERHPERTLRAIALSAQLVASTALAWPPTPFFFFFPLANFSSGPACVYQGAIALQTRTQQDLDISCRRKTSTAFD